MGFMDFVKNVVTFGAHGRLQNEIKYFERLKRELEELNKEMETRKNALNVKLENMVKLKIDCAKSLKKSKRIINKIKIKDYKFENLQIEAETIKADYEFVEKSITTIDVVMNASQGMGVGLTTAAASYFLVGQFATASTGAAISSLSGVAATNAILAWFGGGSIAAGGGGIALGTKILGGIALIPGLIIGGILSHLAVSKQINELKEKEIEILEVMDQIKRNFLIFYIIENRCSEVRESLNKTREVFEKEYKEIMRKLYPFPFFSKIYRKLRELLGYSYFKESELQDIQHFLVVAKSFAQVIEAKIIEESYEV